MASRRPASQHESSAADGPRDPRSPAAGWPWACLRCDATVYHDVRYCRECRRAARRAAAARRRRSTGGFRSWIREQSYPQFVGVVTGIAGVEVALTALWLQVLLAGSAGLSFLPAF